MPVVALAIVGTAAGFIATRLMTIEAEIVVTVSIGVLGAMVLIWLWNTYGPKRG